MGFIRGKEGHIGKQKGEGIRKGGEKGVSEENRVSGKRGGGSGEDDDQRE